MIASAALLVTSCGTSTDVHTEALAAKTEISLPHSATQELSVWFDAFKDYPVLASLVDSIRGEYPSLMKDIAFLDSIRGLKIDFIGMVHSQFDPGLSNDTGTEKAVIVCQSSIRKEIDRGAYDCVATECSISPGPLNLNSFLKEESDLNSEVCFFTTGVRVSFSKAHTDSTYRNFIPNDCVVGMLYSDPRSHPVIIGAEPKWVWLTEQILRLQNINSMPPDLRERIVSFVELLNHSRSEIALVRTARYLIATGKQKRALVVYGRLHLSDFRFLAEKYGTESNYIVTEECEKIQL